MALFEDLKKKVTDTTQGAVRGAKDFADTARLNSLISEEQEKITGLYAQIGRFVFEHSSEITESPVRDLCDAVTAAHGRLAKHQAEIQQIKGVKVCSKCGAEVPVTLAFCYGCGAAIEASAPPAKKFCSGCGAELEPGASFCSNCGA